jgi:hypothetical protein
LVVAESASPAGPSPIEHDASESKNVPAADALHAALARLEQERLAEGSIDAPPPRPGIAPQDAGPRVFATRLSRDPANGPGDEPGSLEALLSDHPSRVAELVRRIDVTTWSRALFGASPALSSRILPCLPPEDERRLAQELRSGRPVRLRDIDAAQAEVRAAWSELRQGLPQIDLAHAGHAVEGRAA